MHDTTVVNNSIKAYIIRVDVEFLHDGQAAQHKLQAALPQQQASCPAVKAARTAPILVL